MAAIVNNKIKLECIRCDLYSKEKTIVKCQLGKNLNQ